MPRLRQLRDHSVSPSRAQKVTLKTFIDSKKAFRTGREDTLCCLDVFPRVPVPFGGTLPSQRFGGVDELTSVKPHTSGERGPNGYGIWPMAGHAQNKARGTKKLWGFAGYGVNRYGLYQVRL